MNHINHIKTHLINHLYPHIYRSSHGFFNPSLGAPGRSTVVAMQDLGSGGSDHHAVATVFEIDTAGRRGKEKER